MLFAMTASAAGPAPVDLGLSANFAILSKAGIQNTPPTHFTGNIGTSPITGASITALDCIQVVGNIFTVDAAGPACRTIDAGLLTTAVKDMQTAYTNAAGRPHGVGSNLNLLGGSVTGVTLPAGTYTWGTPVTITGDITLNGGANDVWIFQIAGTLDLATGVTVHLTGGALPENVFWQVSGAVTLFPGSHFEGTILAKTNIAMQAGATLDGRALAQTAVTLIQSTVTVSGPGDATPKAPNFDQQLNDQACGANLGKPLIDVTEKVINDPDSGLAGIWAYDAYTRHIKVWSTPAGTSGTYCAIVTYDGTAFAIEGAVGPGGSGIIGHDVKAKMKGGYRATIIGTLLTPPLWPIHGSVGPVVDYACCYVDWTTMYFSGTPSFTFDWWGWFYDAGKHGTWLNSIGLTTGNIL